MFFVVGWLFMVGNAAKTICNLYDIDWHAFMGVILFTVIVGSYFVGLVNHILDQHYIRQNSQHTESAY